MQGAWLSLRLAEDTHLVPDWPTAKNRLEISRPHIWNYSKTAASKQPLSNKTFLLRMMSMEESLTLRGLAGNPKGFEDKNALISTRLQVIPSYVPLAPMIFMEGVNASRVITGNPGWWKDWMSNKPCERESLCILNLCLCLGLRHISCLQSLSINLYRNGSYARITCENIVNWQ